MIDQRALIFKCLVDNNSAYPRTKSPNERKNYCPRYALCCLCMFVDDNSSCEQTCDAAKPLVASLHSVAIGQSANDCLMTSSFRGRYYRPEKNLELDLFFG